MSNPQNLIPQAHVLTVEDQSKGGIKSQQVQKQKRTFTEAVKWLTSTDIKINKGNIEELFKKNGINIKGLDSTQLAVLGCWAGAVYGNANNLKTLMEINGELIEEEPSYTPNVEDIEEVVDNSHLEKVMYEEDKHQ